LDQIYTLLSNSLRIKPLESVSVFILLYVATLLLKHTEKSDYGNYVGLMNLLLIILINLSLLWISSIEIGSFTEAIRERACLVTVHLSTLHNESSTQGWIIACFSALAPDVIITAAMSYFLHRSRTASVKCVNALHRRFCRAEYSLFVRKDSLVNPLNLYTFHTGLLPWSVPLVLLDSFSH